MSTEPFVALTEHHFQLGEGLKASALSGRNGADDSG